MKIIYWCSSKQHLRMVIPIKERNDVEQAIVLENSLCEKELHIKNILRYKNIEEIKGIIKTFRPNVFVQYTSNRGIIPILKDSGVSSVFSAHGVWPESNLCKTIVSNPFYDSFDMVCGASYKIKKIFNNSANNKILVITDVLTQVDFLYDFKAKHNNIREKLARGADKLITLFGHNITFKTDKLRPYDEGYYKAVYKLSEVANKNNWMVFIKPKSMKGKKLPPNTKNFVVLDCEENAYQYFCSDLIITSARSTIEVEASLFRKPIIRLPIPNNITEDQKSFEYGALDFNASHIMKESDDLEKFITDTLVDNGDLDVRQGEYIDHLGITFDGKAHDRLIEAFKKFFDN